MNYQQFNRHEIFTAEDLQNVRATVDNLMEHKLYFTDLGNSVCGLYDGYLYEGIDEELYQVLDLKVHVNLCKTLKKIEDHIKANGESITPIY